MKLDTKTEPNLEMELSLINLLVKNKEIHLVQQLLQDFSKNKGFEITGPIPLRQVKDIYCQRAKHNERIGKPIQGFSELVKGLEEFAGEALVIVHVQSNLGDYAVFADSALGEIVGILKFPKKSVVQEVSFVAPLAASERQAA